MKRLLILCLSLFAFAWVQAQDQGAWVFFTDKDGVSFDPYSYFHPKAIERRKNEGLPLSHITDWPVRQDYQEILQEMGAELLFSSRWFNASAVYASVEELQSIAQLPFVKSIESTMLEDGGLAEVEDDSKAPDGFKGLAWAQTEVMGLKEFRAQKINGKGVRVAVFDAGFPGVDKHEAFEHIRQRDGIKATYDFVKNKAFVYDYGAHGTNVLSCIAGKRNGKPLGLATGADFLLARTEMTLREPFSEEKNWLAAAEWADKNGADVINSSLGYTYHRYFTWDMDGKKSLVARAANMAARKGILVVNAAGNEGSTDSWGIVGTPADADSVLSIGGIDPWTNYHINFSSYGPTADGRKKPNVSAFGYAVTAQPKGGYAGSYGTSFASPLVAGFAACAKQAKPQAKAMELFRAIETAGSLYPYYDYAHGHGMPHASQLLNAVDLLETFTVTEMPESIEVTIKDLPEPKPLPGEVSNAPYLYFHYADPKGKIVNYQVVDLEGATSYSISTEDFPAAYQVFIHYRGYSLKIKL